MAQTARSPNYELHNRKNGAAFAVGWHARIPFAMCQLLGDLHATTKRGTGSQRLAERAVLEHLARYLFGVRTDYAADGVPLTVRQFAEEMGAPPATTWRALKRLHALGVVVWTADRPRRGRARRYHIADPERWDWPQGIEPVVPPELATLEHDRLGRVLAFPVGSRGIWKDPPSDKPATESDPEPVDNQGDLFHSGETPHGRASFKPKRSIATYGGIPGEFVDRWYLWADPGCEMPGGLTGGGKIALVELIAAIAEPIGGPAVLPSDSEGVAWVGAHVAELLGWFSSGRRTFTDAEIRAAVARAKDTAEQLELDARARAERDAFSAVLCLEARAHAYHAEALELVEALAKHRAEPPAEIAEAAWWMAAHADGLTRAEFGEIDLLALEIEEVRRYVHRLQSEAFSARAAAAAATETPEPPEIDPDQLTAAGGEAPALVVMGDHGVFAGVGELEHVADGAEQDPAVDALEHGAALAPVAPVGGLSVAVGKDGHEAPLTGTKPTRTRHTSHGRTPVTETGREAADVAHQHGKQMERAKLLERERALSRLLDRCEPHEETGGPLARAAGRYRAELAKLQRELGQLEPLETTPDGSERVVIAQRDQLLDIARRGRRVAVSDVASGDGKRDAGQRGLSDAGPAQGVRAELVDSIEPSTPGAPSDRPVDVAGVEAPTDAAVRNGAQQSARGDSRATQPRLEGADGAQLAGGIEGHAGPALPGALPRSDMDAEVCPDVRDVGDVEGTQLGAASAQREAQQQQQPIPVAPEAIGQLAQHGEQLEHREGAAFGGPLPSSATLGGGVSDLVSETSIPGGVIVPELPVRPGDGGEVHAHRGRRPPKPVEPSGIGPHGADGGGHGAESMLGAVGGEATPPAQVDGSRAGADVEQLEAQRVLDVGEHFGVGELDGTGENDSGGL